MMAIRGDLRQRYPTGRDFRCRCPCRFRFLDVHVGQELGGWRIRRRVGESDGLPGLIADKYGAFLSVQFLSAGVEKNAAAVVEALKEVF